MLRQLLPVLLLTISNIFMTFANTLDSEDVWGGKVEYLRSVKAPEGEAKISSTGYGHRVGLSQHGANILAQDGMSYIEILKYYYSGISFAFI